LALTFTRQLREENYGAFRPVLQELKKHANGSNNTKRQAYKIPRPTPLERGKKERRRQKNTSQKSKYSVLILNFLQSQKEKQEKEKKKKHPHSESEHNCLEKCWLAITT